MLLLLFSGAPVGTLTITTASLTDGVQNVAYSDTLTATGGVPPYTWDVDSGVYGYLTLHNMTGVIDGIPLTPGVFPNVFRVTDSVLSTTTAPLTLTIIAAPTITTLSLPSGVENIAYSTTVSATGGTLPYVWTVDSGSLPTGLSLHSDTGVIDGTPTVPGVYDFVIKVTDDNLNDDTQPLRIVIFGAGGGSSQNPPESRNRGRYRIRDKHKG